MSETKANPPIKRRTRRPHTAKKGKTQLKKVKTGPKIKINWTRVVSGTVLSLPAGVFAVDKYITQIPLLHSSVPFPFDILTGSVGFWAAITLAFLGWYAGFKIKKWPQGLGVFLGLLMAVLILTSIIQPFYMHIMYPSQIEGPPPKYGNIDTSFLSSPFLSDLFESLRNLAEQLLSGNFSVMKVYSADPNNPLTQDDTFLYRWRTFEKYSYTQKDFDLPSGQELSEITYHDQRQDIPDLTTLDYKKLKIELNVTVLADSANQELIVPWNSLYHFDMDEPNWSDNITNPVGATVGSSSSLNNTSNQPFLNVRFQDGNESEFFATANYYTYWYLENKTIVSNNALNYSVALPIIPQDFQDRWGSNSFQGITLAEYLTGADAPQKFQQAYNDYYQYAKTHTIFQIAQKIYNDLISRYVDFNNIQLSNPDAKGQDPAYFVFGELGTPGIEELVLSYVLMLRSLQIPARPVMGYSVGNYVSGTNPYFDVKQSDLHYWVEVLIPIRLPNNKIEYHWAMFNLFPDLDLLSSTGAQIYGKNAFGSSGKFTVNVTSAVSKQTVQQGSDNVEVYVQPLGKTMNVTVNSLDSSDNPNPGQYFELKLVDEDTLNTMLQYINTGNLFQALSVLDANGIKLLSATTNAKGEYNTSIFIYSNGTLSTANYTVKRLNLVSQPNNVYALVAIAGISYGYAGVGFLANGRIYTQTTMLLFPVTNPTNGETVQAAVSFPGGYIDAFANLTEEDGITPIANENIDWYWIPSSEVPDPQNVDFQALQQYKVNTTVTNSSGIATVVIQAGASDSGLYVLGANWQGTDVYNITFVYITNDITLYAVSTDPDAVTQSKTSSNPVTFNLVTQAVAFENTAGINSENTTNLPIHYYLIRDEYYSDTESYDTLVANIGTWTNGTEYYTLSSWEGRTNETGFLAFTLVIPDPSVLAVGLWRIVAISDPAKTHVRHGTGLTLTGTPLPLNNEKSSLTQFLSYNENYVQIGVRVISEKPLYTSIEYQPLTLVINEGITPSPSVNFPSIERTFVIKMK